MSCIKREERKFFYKREIFFELKYYTIKESNI